jgi:hypothetical protein
MPCRNNESYRLTRAPFIILGRAGCPQNALEQLTLRGNPLVSDFVHEMPTGPMSLLELSGRAIHHHGLSFDRGEVPSQLVAYLRSARR